MGFASQQHSDVSESIPVYLEQISKQYYYIYRHYAVVKSKKKSLAIIVFP